MCVNHCSQIHREEQDIKDISAIDTSATLDNDAADIWHDAAAPALAVLGLGGAGAASMVAEVRCLCFVTLFAISIAVLGSMRPVLFSSTKHTVPWTRTCSVRASNLSLSCDIHSSTHHADT
jgi:hypothetical protein